MPSMEWHIINHRDYIDGPYPATLEGAVRSALQALHTLGLRAS